MIVGVCRVTLLASHCHSLKEKRSVVRRIKDRVRAKFHVGIAEVGGQDTWQRAVLGFAVTGSDHRVAEASVDTIVNAIESMALARIASVERDTVVYGDEPFGQSDWIDGAEWSQNDEPSWADNGEE